MIILETRNEFHSLTKDNVCHTDKPPAKEKKIIPQARLARTRFGYCTCVVPFTFVVHAAYLSYDNLDAPLSNAGSIEIFTFGETDNDQLSSFCMFLDESLMIVGITDIVKAGAGGDE